MYDVSPRSATDDSAIERLRRLGGEKLLQQLIDLFVRQTPERIARARAGGATGDGAAVRMPMHALKSSSGQLGAMAMMALCERLEEMGEANRLGDVNARLDELEAEYARVKSWLEAAR